MNISEKKIVYAFSDGSSIGNPGPGGYGVVLKFSDSVKELSKGFVKTTNNRMELLGAIIALDRQEQDKGGEVSKTLMDEFGFPIFSISNLSNLIIFLQESGREGIAEKLRVSLND